MDDKVWSKFPQDVVDIVLAFLPMPVLCRFRTVCKGWNSLISRPEFGTRRIQHPERDTCFIVLREKQGYGFLDLRAKRWYTIKHDQPEIFQVRKNASIATGGGLVCQHVCSNGTYGAGAVFVSNPITKTFRILPPCRTICFSGLPQLSLVVDNVAHTYKVFLMCNFGFPLVAAFNSTTNVWRNLNHPDLRKQLQHERSMIFHNGLLYFLMPQFRTEQLPDHYVLWAYNHIDDTWKETGLEFPAAEFYTVELIVSDGRLFLASWTCQNNPHMGSGPGYHSWCWDGWSYQIQEVHLNGETRLTTVFKMTHAIVTQLRSVKVKAIGCGQSIVLASASYSKNLVVFHLSTPSQWEILPACPMISTYGGNNVLYSWYGATPMCLTLPHWGLQHLCSD